MKKFNIEPEILMMAGFGLVMVVGLAVCVFVGLV